MIAWLTEFVIWYRQIFCDHIWKYDEALLNDQVQEFSSHRGFYMRPIRVTYVRQSCKVCGYHKTYPKY
jgi:hypothetical protein